MPAPAAAGGFPWGFATVLALGLLLYAVMAMMVATSRSSDAAGNGMATAFAAISGVAVWIVLLVLLLLARSAGAMPGWAAAGVFILLPLSAIAAAVALGQFSGHGGWPRFVPLLLPPLLMAYALWARMAGWHGALPPNPTSAVLLGTVAALTIAPFLAAFR